LSEHYQKAYISAREFVESWDKEIYELTNLDFFVYLLINHIGNQLEKHFFIQEREKSELKLSFDNIGTLSFNIGDNFEFFLKDNCFGSCSFKCPIDMNSVVNFQDCKKNAHINKHLFSFNTFRNENLPKEQCMRIHFMNHIILDTLLNFYSEEVSLEVEEEDIDLIELAEFIENVMVEFIRAEGQSLLQKPFEPAMDHFEELISSEETASYKPTWSADENDWQNEQEIEEWQSNFEFIEKLIDKFKEDIAQQLPAKSKKISAHINLFQKFLTEYANVNDSSELDEEHLLEFLSYWLVQQFIFKDHREIPHIFWTIARFVSWLKNNFGLDYKFSFLNYYEKVKTEVPRVVQALNIYLSEYDILGALLLNGKKEPEQISGIYEITELHSRVRKTLDFLEIRYFEPITNVSLDSSAYLKLKKGDLLQATIAKINENWKIIEVQCIYPKVAKTYII
jgi:hypothetical protein